MTGFSERQKGAENKFQHDEEMRFKVGARRAKLLGLWVAGQIGLSGEAADAYAKSMVIEDMTKPGEDDIVAKALADLTAKGLDVSEHRIRKELETLGDQARAQLMKD